MTTTIQDNDYSIDLLQVILWQYDKAPHLKGLITSKQAWYEQNQTLFWGNWFFNVFSLLTANQFGLSVWAIILDVPMFVPATPVNTENLWGFNEIPPVNDYQNFDNGNFALDGSLEILTLEEQRFILRLRYYQLTSNGSVHSINQFLNYLCATSSAEFSVGTIFAIDNLDMTMTYEFTFPVPVRLKLVIEEYKLLPSPAGVKVLYTW